MKTLTVETAGGRYPIAIGRGTVGRLPGWIRRHGAPSSIHVVTDSRVRRLHGRAVVSALAAVAPVRVVEVPAGERSKSVRGLETVWRRVLRSGLDRRGMVVALGGGVVGDLAGFAAASLLRGVRLVQVPTTLLAMVDSSVGGKTGINLPEGKNLVGAFFQPAAVFIDLRFLRTLPRREVRAGWAEIIKAAAIGDARLFRLLEESAERLLAGDGRLLERVVRSACRIKARVVGADEKEAGLRMVLNYGHTLAHGLEAAVGYRGLLHGEAVAIGIAFAARFGLALGRTDPDAAERIVALLRRFRLPVRAPARYPVAPSRVLSAMGRDKKAGPGGLRWVLVPRIGSAAVHEDIPWDGARLAVETFLRN